jgi:hypothetical protein
MVATVLFLLVTSPSPTPGLPRALAVTSERFPSKTACEWAGRIAVLKFQVGAVQADYVCAVAESAP